MDGLYRSASKKMFHGKIIICAYSIYAIALIGCGYNHAVHRGDFAVVSQCIDLGKYDSAFLELNKFDKGLRGKKWRFYNEVATNASNAKEVYSASDGSYLFIDHSGVEKRLVPPHE